MARHTNIHVIPCPNTNKNSRRLMWGVLKEGNKNVTEIFNTQRAAIYVGRSIARSNNRELVIRDRNGLVRKIVSYRKH